MCNFLKLSCIISLVASTSAFRVSSPNRIKGGDYAQDSELKYVVALTHDNELVCSGGIIGEQFVLTAAHCLISAYTNRFKNTRIQIVAGRADFSLASDEDHFEVDKYYVPTEYMVDIYNPGGRVAVGDVAVIKIKGRFNLNTTSPLQKLNLPTTLDAYENKTAIVAGFGNSDVGSPSSGKRSGVLKYVEAKIIPRSKCSKKYRKTIGEKLMCARAIQRDRQVHGGACAGDSGAALVHGNLAIGVYNGGSSDCDEMTLPGMYTVVSRYLSLIEAALNDSKADHHVRVASWMDDEELVEEKRR